MTVFGSTGLGGHARSACDALLKLSAEADPAVRLHAVCEPEHERHAEAVAAWRLCATKYPQSGDAPQAMLQVAGAYEGPLADLEEALTAYETTVSRWPNTKQAVEARRILAELDSDDAAELIAAMPEEQGERILDVMKDSASEPVEGLLSYEEETAGRIMSPEVFALAEEVAVSDAIAALRTSRSEDLEMVFYLYVVDERRHLVGVASLREKN